jgi:predicted methyltransferase
VSTASYKLASEQRVIGSGCAGRPLQLMMCLLTLWAQHVVADAVPDYLASAIADAHRPDTDRRRDLDRKPAEVIAFAGLKPGDIVADFMPGRNRYFTKIFCRVVGHAGRVYAVSVPSANSPAGATIANQSTGGPSEDCANIIDIRLQPRNYPAPELYNSSDDPGAVYQYYSQRLPAESFVAPEPLDMIWTAENYHDLHNGNFGTPNMLWVSTALLQALKPGGILIVEDHAAAPRTGTRDTETLHRIDPERVKAELLAAGFEFVSESDVLHHSEDAHTLKAHEMHDRTDRFLFKFRRPSN